MRETRSGYRGRWVRFGLVLLWLFSVCAFASSPASAADGPVAGVTVTVLGQRDAGGSDLLIDPPSGVRTVLTFTAGDWDGAYFNPESTHYGRPWVALYGSQSDYPSGTLRFTLNIKPLSKVTLTLTGVSDETGTKDRIKVAINNKVIYIGAAWFKNWDGKGSDDDAPWTTVDLLVPQTYFIAGGNTITVSNLKVAANFGSTPYVLLGAARLSIPGGGAKVS